VGPNPQDLDSPSPCLNSGYARIHFMQVKSPIANMSEIPKKANDLVSTLKINLDLLRKK